MAGRIERSVVAFLVSGTAGLAFYVGLRGLRMLPVLAALLAVPLAVGGGLWLVRRLPAALDGLRRRRPWLCAAWLLLGLVAFGQTARQSAFMLDPARPEHSLLPGDDWTVEHCCLTAYAEGARLARAGEPNVYRPELYKPSPTDDRQLGGFNVDLYHYPPPFLLLPLAAQAATGGGFLDVRALWFGVTALMLMLAMGGLAYRLEPLARLRAIAVAPVIWCSLPVQLGLQMSNFQVLVVAMSVLAFVALPRRAAVGGALLAVSAVSKIFPGLLALYLVARRRWREAAWSAGFAVVFCALALAVLGPTPFRAFVGYELPRLSSGEAFARPLSRPFPVARNMAPFGIPLKVNGPSASATAMPMSRLVSTGYGLAVLALAFWSARRVPRSTEEAAAVWLALLSLGTLASPFAPANYVLVSLVWLVCLDRGIGRPWVVAAVWLLTSLPLLLPRDGSFLFQTLAFLPAQALALGVPALVLYRAGRKHPQDQAQGVTATPVPA